MYIVHVNYSKIPKMDKLVLISFINKALLKNNLEGFKCYNYSVNRFQKVTKSNSN